MWCYERKIYRIVTLLSIMETMEDSRDKLGIIISRKGWDSEMTEYSLVSEYKGIRYMLYNENGYGKTGFGIAVLFDD